MKHRLLAILALLLLLTACSNTIQKGLIDGSILVDGQERTYQVYVPDTYTGTRFVPLLVVLHGGSQTGADIMRISGLNNVADQEGFIVAYPNGMQTSWNDGRGTTNAAVAGVDDVNFLKQMIVHVSSEYNVEDQGVFVTGVSNGGIMAYRLACEASDSINGIIPVVASMAEPLTTTCNPSSPVSLLSIQGTSDPFININGGAVQHRQFPRLGDGGVVISNADVQEFWATQASCETTPMTEVLPSTVTDGTSVKKVTYVECANDMERTFFIVDGMGHVWSPEPSEHPDISGVPSGNMRVNEEIVHFMYRHLPLVE